MAVTAINLALGLIFFININIIGRSNGALQVGFYKGKCNSADVENVIFQVVKTQFIKDSTIAAALLRMQFHDCWINGCDASILVDGNNSEKTAFANAGVRGYEIIDLAKAAVEAICPSLVSCADIVAIATRDAVSLSGGGKYAVETGRRDGTVSLSKNVNFISSAASISTALTAFASKGFNSTDLVFLLGAHSIGSANCFFIQNRLYNFQNTRKPDPTMDSNLQKKLGRTCPQTRPPNGRVNLDQNPTSSMILDNSYYKQILLHRGILDIDQELALDPLTNATVAALANGKLEFSSKFGEAMVKLGKLQVLTGNQGQIRKSCRIVNKT